MMSIEVQLIEAAPKIDINTERSRSLVFSFTSSKDTIIMKVKKAITAIGNEEKGASVSAIVTWILGNYLISDPDKLRVKVKKVILKALEDKTLQRSVTSINAVGSTGSFILSKPKRNSKTSRKSNKSFVDDVSEAKTKKKSIALKANALRETKIFPKIPETGKKSIKLSSTDIQKYFNKNLIL